MNKTLGVQGRAVPHKSVGYGYDGVKNIILTVVFLGFLIPFYRGLVLGKEPDNLIGVDPDLIFLGLGFIENQLDAEVKMGPGHAVDVLAGGVAGHPQVADDLPSLDHLSFI